MKNNIINLEEFKMKSAMRKLGYREDFDPNNRIIKQDYFELGDRRYFMSTVDLGIDHSFFNDKPIYWETMIFDHTNGENFGDLYQERYSSLEDAIANHERILTLVTEGNFTTIKELSEIGEQKCNMTNLKEF